MVEQSEDSLLVSLEAVEKADLGKLIVGILQHLDRLQREVDKLRRLGSGSLRRWEE